MKLNSTNPKGIKLVSLGLRGIGTAQAGVIKFGHRHPAAHDQYFAVAQQCRRMFAMGDIHRGVGNPSLVDWIVDFRGGRRVVVRAGAAPDQHFPLRQNGCRVGLTVHLHGIGGRPGSPDSIIDLGGVTHRIPAGHQHRSIRKQVRRVVIPGRRE